MHIVHLFFSDQNVFFFAERMEPGVQFLFFIHHLLIEI